MRRGTAPGPAGPTSTPAPPEAPARGTGRRVMLLAGIAMLICGLALSGYGAWQYWGTNIVSRQHQQEAADELRRAWERGEGAADTRFGTATAVIEIPGFGDDYSIPVFDGTGDDVLAAGFGHFEGSAGPGEVGNYAVAAHRVTHGEPLRQLPELEVGDEVRVVTRTTTYVYTLTSDGDALTVPFSAGWVLDPLPTNPDGGVQPARGAGQRLITLTTCSELFHTDDRLVAFGVLSDTVPTSAR